MDAIGRKILRFRVDKETPYLLSYINNEYRWCESLPERNHILGLEFQRKVKSYNTQPFSVEYLKDNGKKGIYTPDVICHNENGFRLIEVKSNKCSKKDDVLAHYERIDHYCRKELSMRLDVVFAEDNKVDNLLRLYKYKNISPSHFNDFKIERMFNSDFTFQELRDALSLKGCPPVIAFALLAHQKVEFDYATPLTNNTLLEVA